MLPTNYLHKQDLLTTLCFEHLEGTYAEKKNECAGILLRELFVVHKEQFFVEKRLTINGHITHIKWLHYPIIYKSPISVLISLQLVFIVTFTGVRS